MDDVTTSPQTDTQTDVESDARTERLTLRIKDSGVEIVSRVEAPGAMNRRDPNRNAATFFRIVSLSDGVLFERGFEMPAERRAEFADENGKLTRVSGPMEPLVISIVVPVNAQSHKLQLFRKAPGAAGGSNGTDAGTLAAELIGEVSL